MRRLSWILCVLTLASSLLLLSCSPEPPVVQDGGVSDSGGAVEKSSVGEGPGEKSGCLKNEDCKPEEYCDGDRCVSDKCKPGAKICDKKFESVLTCNEAGSVWDNPKPCGANEVCQQGKCVVQNCSPGEKKCEQGAIVVCNNSGTGFEQSKPCQADEYCEQGGCRKQTCKPGIKTCEGNNSKVCSKNGSGFEEKPCGEKQFCDQGDCKDRICNPGEKSCSGNTARTCNKRGAGYNELPCSSQEACDQGACKVQICKPGETKCLDNTTTEECDTKGLAWKKSACAGGEYCDKGVCTKQACKPGVKECVNATETRTCKAGGSGWSVLPCAKGEGCDAGVCKKQICTPGTKRCVPGEVVEACSANGLQWRKTQCKSGEFCELGVCTTQKCTPNKRECLNDIQVRTCKPNGSGWVVSSCGSGESCDSAVCKKQICSPNTSRCAGSFAVETCSSKGLKWTRTSCSSSEFCSAGSCKQQVCAPKKRECVSASQARRCKDNGSAWVLTTCGAGSICDAGVCKAQVCKPNAVSCANGTTVQTCGSKGLTKSTTPCQTGQYCYQGKCFSGTCKVGVKRCTGSVLEECESTPSGGAWAKRRTCSSGCAVQGDNAFCKCTTGSEQCYKNELEVCQSKGSGLFGWSKISTCKHGCYQDAGKAFCKCSSGTKSGQFYCVGSDRYVCNPTQKAEGAGVKQSTCAHGCYQGTGPAVVKTDQFYGGNLLNNAQKKQINSWANTPKQNWILCYKSSLYGSSTAAFHKHCDNKGPTVTVVKLNGGKSSERLVGGYASDSWGKNVGYFGDKSSFLFSLTNNYKHAYDKSTFYVLSNPNFGPTWGGGNDFSTGSEGVVGNKVVCNLGFTYRCRIGAYGSKDCREDFCGMETNPAVTEVEVYYKAAGSQMTGAGQAYCLCPGGKKPGEFYCSGKTSYFCQTESTLSTGSFASYPCSASCSSSGFCQCTDRGKNYNHNTSRCQQVNLFEGSTLLNKTQSQQINTWIGTSGQYWTLCYKSSLHGAFASVFHSRCNGKVPTVMVAKLNAGQSNERLIGGYTSTSWSGSGYTGTSSNFLFSLTNNFKHSYYRNSRYQYNNDSYGPTWGGGHDFYTNLGTSSYCNIGYSFRCRTGSYGSSTCRNDFCGQYRPVLSELEVFEKRDPTAPTDGTVIFACQQQRLKEGKWVVKKDCGKNQCLGQYTSAANATAVCNICVPKTYRCSGSDNQQCLNPTGKAFAWVKNTTCKYGCYGAGFCKCPAARSLRQAYCIGNTRYICKETYDANGTGSKQNTCTHGCYNGTGPATGSTDLFNGGSLLTFSQMRQINAWAGTPYENWTLCYKRSVHGATATEFHKRCDGKGPTVMVAKLNGGQKAERLIGGYADSSWNSGGRYFGNNTSFLFSLTNNHKHAWYRYRYYQYGKSNYGPTWGGGHDFYTNLGASSYCNLGHTYRCRTGAYGNTTCRNDFCGQYRPVLTEVEVYYKGGVPLGGSAQAYCKCAGGLQGDQQYCSANARYKCLFTSKDAGEGIKLGDCSNGCEVRTDQKAYCK